jgi:hypothetical protein
VNVRGKDGALAAQLTQLAGGLAATNGADATATARVAALRKTLGGIAAQLR